MDDRYRLVLSSKYADIIRNDARLSLSKNMQDVGLKKIDIPAERAHSLVVDVSRRCPRFRIFALCCRREDYTCHDKSGDFALLGLAPHSPHSNHNNHAQLTRVVSLTLVDNLDDFIEPHSTEAAFALEGVWNANLGTSSTLLLEKILISIESHELPLKDFTHRVVAQVLCRAFLNDDMCRDPEWINLSTDCVDELFMAARELRFFPKAVRHTASKFIPRCRKTRGQILKAQKMIEGLLAKQKGQAKKPDNKTSAPTCFEWLTNRAQGSPEVVTALFLGLCIVSYDTITEQLSLALCNMSQHPQLIDDLRDEIKQVERDGLNKQSIQNMSLMDSVLKETQRLGPPSCGNYSLSCHLCEIDANDVMTPSDNESNCQGDSYPPRWTYNTKRHIFDGFSSPHAGLLSLVRG